MTCNYEQSGAAERPGTRWSLLQPAGGGLAAGGMPNFRAETLPVFAERFAAGVVPAGLRKSDKAPPEWMENYSPSPRKRIGRAAQTSFGVEQVHLVGQLARRRTPTGGPLKHAAKPGTARGAPGFCFALGQVGLSSKRVSPRPRE